MLRKRREEIVHPTHGSPGVPGCLWVSKKASPTTCITQSLVIRNPDGSWKILDSDGQPTIKEGTIPSAEVREAIYSTVPPAKVERVVRAAPQAEFAKPLLNQTTLDLVTAQPDPFPPKKAQDAVVDADTGDLIPHELSGVTVYQRKSDGYFNATPMCKAAGKMIGHWSQNAETKQVIASLWRSIGIAIDLLVNTITTGRNEERGTWVHKKVRSIWPTGAPRISTRTSSTGRSTKWRNPRFPSPP